MLKSFLKNFQPKLIKVYLFRFAIFCIQYLLYHPARFRNYNIRKILVIRLKHLGDYILTLPFLEALHDNFPAAQLIVATGSWNRPLVQEFDQNISEVFYYNVKRYCRKKSQIMQLAEKLNILKKLSKSHIDLVIDLDGAAGFLWLYLFRRTKFLSSIESLRFLQNLQQSGILKTNRTSYNIHTQYELFNLTESLKQLGLSSKSVKIDLKPKSETKQAVNSFFKEKCLDGHQPTVGIQPFTFLDNKLWIENKFAELADKFINRYNAKIVFFGAPEEQAGVRSIQLQMSNPSIDGTYLTLAQFIAAVGRCQLFVCLDSMPQHAAYLQNVSTVVLYMTDNFQRWTPPNSDSFAVVYNKNGIEPGDVLEQIPKTFLSNYEMMQ